MVLLRELADGLALVPVGLPQLDLLALQLALQMLDVRLQLGHAALPLPLAALEAPAQLVLLLLQVLWGTRGRALNLPFLLRTFRYSRERLENRSHASWKHVHVSLSSPAPFFK